VSFAGIEGAWPSAYYVRDPAATISVGEGCVALDAHTAVCSAASGAMYHVVVRLGDGDDILRAAGFDLVRADGGEGSDTLLGGTWDDDLDGGPGSDELRGGAGADALHGGPGADADVLDGGADVDRVSYEGRTEALTVDLSDPAVDGAAGESDTLVDLEDITGGIGDDRLVGTGGDNRIDAGGGSDVILALSGNDLIRTGDAGSVDCGAGRELVRGVRRAVLLASNCETVAHGIEWDEVRADVRPGRGGRFKVTCPEYDGEPLACDGRVTLTEPSGARRLLGSGVIPRGKGQRVGGVTLTTAGRRLARRGPVRATLRLDGRGIPALAWTIVL
jgi:Ca2+-binding RTX toxin-like protein